MENKGVVIPDKADKMQEPVPIPVAQQVKPNRKRHLNVVLIGHADSGKSTIGGQILCLTNQVDHEKLLENKERAVVANNTESSYLANMMVPKKSETDRFPQIGRAFFETVRNRFTLLDARGGKDFEHSMISGVIQADICVLVISARKGEIDRAFYEDFWQHFPGSGKIISEEQKDKFSKEILGQTFEHVQIAKDLGVSKLIVVVNKMDHPTVNWSKVRYDQIKKKMVGFLELTGYNTENDVVFLPMSGLHGINMDKSMDPSVCNWWGDRPYFFRALDSIADVPFRMLITGTCKSEDGKIVIMGKVESGTIMVDDQLVIMPIQKHVKVFAIHCNEDEVTQAGPLEALKVYITGAEEMDMCSGFVLSSTVNPVPVVDQFVAELRIDKRLSMPDYVMSGYEATIYIHGVSAKCYFTIIETIDPKTRRRTINKTNILRGGGVALCRIVMIDQRICLDGRRRFILRKASGAPLAVGRVTNI